MYKFLTILVGMVSFLISANAEAKDKFNIYLKQGNNIKLLGLLPGEPGNKKADLIIGKILQKFRGKILVCQGLTDGIKCQGKTGWADEKCQANLRLTRCGRVGNVARKFGIDVFRAVGGAHKKIGPQYRGVIIKVLKTAGVKNCKKDNFKKIKKVFYNDSRKVINKYSLAVIPELQKPENIHKNKVVYITYSPFIKDGKLLYPLPRVCRARVNLAQVVEKPEKPEVRIVDRSGKTEFTQKSKPKVGTGSGAKVVKEKKTMKVVKKDPKPEPTETEDATSQLYLTIGGIYGKPCAMMSKSSAFNLSVALGYHFFDNSKGMLNLELGVTTSSRTVLDGNEIVEKSHEFNFHTGIEALGKIGPVALGGGYKLLFNQHFEYQNRFYLKALYHFTPKWFIYGEAGVALFKYRDEYRLDENPENSYFLFGGVGIGLEF